MKKILILFFLLSIVVNAQQLSFPTAYGAGAYTTGGRGGKVVHVTNLNDSGTGSLRWALTDASNSSVIKTVVFDVSGVINLSSNIVVSGDRAGGSFAHGLTIAGQTAPEGGITITGGKIRMFSVDNVIARYLKFRETTATDGCFSNTNGSNVIFDHLSGSHSPDIIFALTSSEQISDNKTLQHCLLAQSKNGFITGDSSPSNFQTSYHEQISILRNAYYNVGWRIPLKGGARIRVDAINNIAHNWSARLTRMDGFAYELNHIGNYYQGGYNTTNILKHCSYLSPYGNPKIYNLDNYMDPAETTAEYNTDESVVWTEFQDNFTPLPSSYFTNTPNPIRGRAIPILSSSELKTEVLPEVGAFRYIKDDGTVGIYRDSYDTAHINGIDIDDSSSRSTAITVGDMIAAVPSNTRPGTFYVSNDHIPEVYLDARAADLAAEGISKTDADVEDYVMPSGYTLLEEYFNQVDGAPVVVLPTSVDITPNDPTINIPNTIDLDLVWNTTTPTNQTGTWVSSNTGVATVSSSGVVTPVSAGITTITFTANELDANDAIVENDISVTVTNIVNDVTSVDITPSTASIGTNETLQLDVDFTPTNATDQTGVWTSNATSVATVNSNGLVTPVSEGSATITFTANDSANGTITDNSAITVTTATTPRAAILDSVVVSNNSYILYFHTTAGTEVPLGNYNTYITSSETGGVRQNQDDNADFTGFTRTITELNMSIAQTFEVDARYLQYDPSQFYMSNAITVQPIIDTTNPTTPTNASVTDVGTTTATVTWGASIDENLVGYEIRSGLTVISNVTGGTTYNFTGLSPNNGYSYDIVAYDALGNESSALTFSFTTTKIQSQPMQNGKVSRSRRKIIISY
jgi:hypothetical protein